MMGRVLGGYGGGKKDDLYSRVGVDSLPDVCMVETDRGDLFFCCY